MLMTDTRNLEIAARLRKVASWNDFARTILADLDRGRYVNANQMLAAERMMDNLDARQNQKGQPVDLSPIREMFEAAVASGLKRPAYRALGLKITLAPATGMNAGALYVVTEANDNYEGKIIGTAFKATRVGDVHQKLLQIAQNPLEVAIEYGRKTGRCACCGKELTNAESVELGIGPICKKKWSL